MKKSGIAALAAVIMLASSAASSAPGPGEKERAKRIALFYQTLERQPFFLSPATDLAGLAEAAARLRDQEKRFLAFYDLKEPERLYPAEFLAAYAEASASFDRFSDSRSEKNAREVLKQIKKAVKAYSVSAREVSSSVDRHFYNRGMDLMAGVGGQSATDKAIILADLALIKKNAAAAERRLADLEGCLLKSSRLCRNSWPDMAFLSQASPAASTASIMPSSTFAPEGQGLRGPYLVQTRCWGGKAANYLYARERPLGAGDARMEWDDLATDLFFGKTNLLRSSDTLSGRRFRLVPFSATSSYSCNDMSYKPFLRTLDHFVLRYASSPASAAIAPPSLNEEQAAAVRAAADAERLLFLEPFPSQDRLENLGAAYFAAFKALERSKTAGRQEYLARARLINLKTTGMGLLVNRLAFAARSLNDKVRSPRGAKRPRGDPSAFFQTRSAYSLTFMPFSPSVWLLPMQPVLLSTASLPASSYWFDHKQALETLGRSELDRTLKYFIEHGRYEKVPEVK